MWQQVNRAYVPLIHLITFLMHLITFLIHLITGRCYFDTPNYNFNILDYRPMYENYNLLHYTLPFLLGLILRLEGR